MALAGKNGSLRIGTETVTRIQNWSLDLNLDTYETTALGDDWKEFISGLKEWSASAEGKWNIVNDAAGQKALQDAYLAGNSVTLRLYVNATKYYEGTAFISSLGMEDPVDDVVSISMEFQGSGALTYN